MECKICGNKEYRIVYEGIIRDGCFGKYTKEAVSIYQCGKCGAMYHKNKKADDEAFYESEKYRESMGEKINDYELLHDKEVLEKLQYTGTDIFRNRIVADIGCGGGCFLDFVKGAAFEAIGIEPTEGFREKMKAKGYPVYAYAADAMEKYKNKVDVLTSFDVIEHVKDPLLFLKECYGLCKEGGKVIIGTPTEQPIMRMALGEEYDKFLFSTQHLWILNKESMEIAARLAGFKNVEVKYKQRYGLGNLISWLKNRKPMGNVEYEYIADSVSRNWIANSEERGMADYIVLYAEK